MPPSVTERPQLVSPRRLVYPPTPYISSIPLPGHPHYRRAPTPDLYPIDLTTNLSSSHAHHLSDVIPPFTTIAVHTASQHLLFHVKTGSYALTSAEFVHFMQHFVRTPLVPPTNLSANAKRAVKEHFMSRRGMYGHEEWRRYGNGDRRFTCPTGMDLLLGNTMMWSVGFDMHSTWTALVHTPVPHFLS
ncbi:hypothetical protein C8J57DRAFT_136508 [Mycena rebaudengoi]|nr:hypothetical protein C8J57DRAFT_136508 [Mycena rebaudengoi]